MSASVGRVRAALAAAGLPDSIREMPQGTRTAADAASACGCELDQIAKSLVFAGAGGRLHLLLVAGGNRVDLDRTAAETGEPLAKADAAEVRRRTGFAIGGVAPLGHLEPAEVWIDPRLLAFPLVWAAAGTPRHVFGIDPQALRTATGALLLRDTAQPAGA